MNFPVLHSASRCNDCDCSSDSIIAAGGCPMRFDKREPQRVEFADDDMPDDMPTGSAVPVAIVCGVLLLAVLALCYGLMQMASDCGLGAGL